MSFLTAEWRKLAIANYIIDPAILKPLIPKGTVLDYWQGNCYVSLVGFMFLNTKILGMKIPFHVHFEEVNLRYYVQHESSEGWRRGVVFIREIVPKPAVTWIANTLYREHYATMPMKHTWKVMPRNLEVAYSWKCRRAWQHFSVRSENGLQPMASGSEAEFITEHYWGYSGHDTNKTVEYAVTHPRWEIYPVLDYDIQVDFGACYGSAWKFLNNSQPASVMLAEGSPITIEGKRWL